MTRIAFGTAVAVLAAIVSFVQDRAVSSQSAADLVDEGRSHFEMSCSDCHGIDAKGVLGPNLTGLWAAGASDERVFQTIRRGVPGSEMPASTAPDPEIRAIVMYLKSLNTTVPPDTSAGDPANGEQIFWKSCGGCHRVNGRGGHLGPDLSRVGSSRPRDALSREIRVASTTIVPGYQAVTLVTADGQRVRGARKSEDAFSIQIMDIRERLQGYDKATLREVVYENRSLMPDFGPDRLNDRDLGDLLRYLGTLRGSDAGRP